MPFPTPNGEQTFIDPNGDPYTGGSVYSYVPGTTTPSPTYTDETMSVANPNPVVLDGAGRAVMWTDLITRQVVYDMFGTLVWDRPTGIEIDQIPGNLSIAGNLTVSGTSTFNGPGVFNAGLTASSADITGNLAVGGNETIGGTETVTGLITANGGITDNGTLTQNGTANFSGPNNFAGTSTFNGPINAPAGFTGNIVAAPGNCVVTNCIEANGADYISTNANLYITQQSNAFPNAMTIQSPDPASYSDYSGRSIQIVSNDNPYIAFFNTFGGPPALAPWVMWGGVIDFNIGLANADNGDPSVGGSTQLMTLDESGNMTILGTLTQGALAADSPLMADGALAVVNSAVVRDAGVEPPFSARGAGGGTNESALIAVLWKAVQELSARVPA